MLTKVGTKSKLNVVLLEHLNKNLPKVAICTQPVRVAQQNKEIK
jgi:hypothetical protein